MKSPIPHYKIHINKPSFRNYDLVEIDPRICKSPQTDINEHRLLNWDFSKMPTTDKQYPLIILTKRGDYVVEDGNHRVTMALRNRVPLIKVRLVKERR